MSSGSPIRQNTHPARQRSAGVDRLAALGGLIFFSFLIIQNALRAGAPSFGAAPPDVAHYFVHSNAAVLVPLGLFPVGMVALFAFTAGVWSRASEGAARWWAAMGALGVTAIASLFALVNITEIILAAKAADLESSMSLVRAVWAMHAAAFGLVLAAQAAALLGLGRAATTSGIISSRLGVPLLVGVPFLLVAAVFTTAMANGGPWIAVGGVGFVTWGVFVLAASIGLARAR